MIDQLRSRSAFQLSYLEALIEDIPPDRMAEQPAPLMNHPAWLLGHLAWASDVIPALLGGSTTLDAAWADLFNAWSRPQPVATLYPDKATLIQTLQRTHAAASESLSRVTPERLAAEFPDPTFRAVMPTIGDALFHILTTHEATHAGQLSAWRRAAGLPPTRMMAFAAI